MAKRILIIEDDPDQILLYKTEFEIHGFEVATERKSTNGEQKAMEFMPDLILMDLLMEEMNGLEVLAKIKQNNKINKIPVLIFSNFEKQEKGAEALRLGAVDYIIKSKTMPKELVQKVNAIIKKSKK